MEKTKHQERDKDVICLSTCFHTRIHFYITTDPTSKYIGIYIERKVVSLLMLFIVFIFLFRSTERNITDTPVYCTLPVTSFHSTIFYMNHIKYIRILLQDKSETKSFNERIKKNTTTTGAFATKNRDMWNVSVRTYQKKKTQNICSLLFFCSFYYFWFFTSCLHFGFRVNGMHSVIVCREIRGVSFKYRQFVEEIFY